MDGFETYDPETGSGKHPCDHCGEWMERCELEIADTLELCPACLEDYMMEQQINKIEYEPGII